MKVIAIQGSIDWEQKNITELMSNLQTYEMQMFSNDESVKKGNFVSFRVEEQDIGSET